MEAGAIDSEGLAWAVIDTSSLVPASLRQQLQEAAQLQLYVGMWSPWIIAELNRVLSWRWIKRYGNDRESERRCSLEAKAMMSILLPSFELVAPLPPYPPPWPTLPDMWDYPIWVAAKQGAATYVVSENTRHFPPKDSAGRHMHEGIEYLKAVHFLEHILGVELSRAE